MTKIEEDLREGTFHFEQDSMEEPIKISFDKDYLHELLFNISHQFGVLDDLIVPHLDRPLHEVHAIEHAILWIALYEFKERLEIPYKVIINEAILLAKQFGAQDSHKFVNGVLDKAAKVVREREVAGV